MNWKKFEEIRRRARKLQEREQNGEYDVMWDNSKVPAQLFDDILWLCRQIDSFKTKAKKRKNSYNGKWVDYSQLVKEKDGRKRLDKLLKIK